MVLGSLEFINYIQLLSVHFAWSTIIFNIWNDKAFDCHMIRSQDHWMMTAVSNEHAMHKLACVTAGHGNIWINYINEPMHKI